ncbi:hypothetical protein TFLX_04441 [Thermoflexales bacterium]|nr:hypothetical protein TFLX_04441 [Thermoflexales bacterium]
MSELLLAAAVIIIFIAVISLLEYQVKTKGPLFSGIATPRMRLLALLLGIVFAVLFVGQVISSESIQLAFPVLAVALMGYSFGAGALLRNIQGEPDPDKTDQEIESESLLPLNQIGRLLLILGIGFVLAAMMIYAAMLATTHPDNPLSLVLVIGVIVLFVVARLRNWLGLFTRR